MGRGSDPGRGSKMPPGRQEGAGFPPWAGLVTGLCLQEV